MAVVSLKLFCNFGGIFHWINVLLSLLFVGNFSSPHLIFFSSLLFSVSDLSVLLVDVYNGMIQCLCPFHVRFRMFMTEFSIYTLFVDNLINGACSSNVKVS